jgi:hypothetical protein
VDRFILRFEGQGEKPAEDVRRIRSLPNATVLDDSSSMILIEGPRSKIASLIKSLPGWSCSPECFVPVPDARPKLRKSSAR